MEDNRKLLQRIRQMERHLNRASSAIKRLSVALDKYKDAQESTSAISGYYGSDDWKQDFAAVLPQDLWARRVAQDNP